MNLHQLIARKIRKSPDAISAALTTLKQWESIGEIPENRMKEWRSILEDANAGKSGRKTLTAILRSNSERARRLLDFSPFAGVLTREERRKVFLKCRYDH